jgi:hypothetical protein
MSNTEVNKLLLPSASLMVNRLAAVAAVGHQKYIIMLKFSIKPI